MSGYLASFTAILFAGTFSSFSTTLRKRPFPGSNRSSRHLFPGRLGSFADLRIFVYILLSGRGGSLFFSGRSTVVIEFFPSFRRPFPFYSCFSLPTVRAFCRTSGGCWMEGRPLYDVLLIFPGGFLFSGDFRFFCYRFPFLSSFLPKSLFFSSARSIFPFQELRFLHLLVAPYSRIWSSVLGPYRRKICSSVSEPYREGDSACGFRTV